MTRKQGFYRLFAVMVVVFTTLPSFESHAQSGDEEKRKRVKAALTVSVVAPRNEVWAERIKASGRIVPWQDVVVAAETSGLRVISVGAEVGDIVKKGQVLATLAPELVQIEMARAEARVAQAEAKLEEARSNAKRSRTMQSTGALSTQQLDEYRILEKMAEASLAIEKASLDQERLRLRQTTIVAPDDGIVSVRNASLGQVVQAGTELYRLIRQSKLIWLAEVSADQLPRIQIGQRTEVILPGEIRSGGAIRRVSPQLDESSLNALISVSLENNPAIKAGMYGSGEIHVGEQPAMTLPESAIAWRDGKSYLFTLDRAAEPLRVTRQHVQLGRRYNGQVEVLSGLPVGADVVQNGAAFLSDGDVVRLADQSVAQP